VTATAKRRRATKRDCTNFLLGNRVASHRGGDHYGAVYPRLWARTVSMIEAATTAGIASVIKPRWWLPVRSFISPIQYGPVNPPTIPMVVIAAMPAAADLPLRKLEGIAKKDSLRTVKAYGR